jgi:hypothetical protein
VLELLADNDLQVPVKRFGLPDHFIEHGPVPTLHDEVGLTSTCIVETVRAIVDPTGSRVDTSRKNSRAGAGSSELSMSAT